MRNLTRICSWGQLELASLTTHDTGKCVARLALAVADKMRGTSQRVSSVLHC